MTIKSKVVGSVHYSLIEFSDRLLVLKMDFSTSGGAFEPVMGEVVAIFNKKETDRAEKFFDSI